ncbi:HPr family phosphocarrier protein [Ponticaulis profundi]|uniref:Phosphocarrier protein HPr n=1 Tax=Ponticaulis profundi TaxID=2665222 RepID=A0ABW1S8P7_9PROT
MACSSRVEIVNQRGLHARASAAFSRLAQQYDSAVLVSREGIEADGKSIMELLTLAASKGSTIEISANGTDESDAVSALEALVVDRFGEDE